MHKIFVFSYKKHNTHSCDKYYCRSCLRLSYDMNLDAKAEKNFICPSCRDHCSCSRCFRYEQLIKIIACYITLSGDINKLYDFLTENNSIMELLKENLVLSKFVIFDMSDRSSSEKIKQNKNTAAIFTSYERKAPHIANTNSTAGTNQNKA